jgi:transcriptional regulator with PAS, ATPase and Fis domain
VKIDTWVKIILDSLYDGVLIADSNNIVRYINPAYKRITQVEDEDVLNMSLHQVRPGARLPSVIKSGKKLLGIPRKVGNIEYVVNMVPIKENDNIIGGISILNEVNDIHKLSEELRQSNSTIQKLENHMKSIERARYSFKDIISVDSNSINMKNLAVRIAGTDSNVLITGESGTGKELYAHSIHNASHRHDGPFIAVNSATFDSNLLESELFGYEEGAFTGSKKGGKIGLFELANGGTLFLDEISEMNFNLQAKLLRVLQENRIRRIGGLKEINIDVRIITATNKDLEKMISNHEFREDLFYRISIFPMHILPLRERKEDILPLIEFFISKIAYKMKRSISISPEVRDILYNYSWPGNIRELRNTMEFAANMTDDYIIKGDHLPKIIQIQSVKNNLIKLKPLEEIVRQTELAEIKKALSLYGDNVDGKQQAADALGISLATLYNKLKQAHF